MRAMAEGYSSSAGFVRLGMSFETPAFSDESSERALGKELEQGYNVLREVEILEQNLSWQPNSQAWEVNEAAAEYVFANELTAACEAVDGGGLLWVGRRPWDEELQEFLAFEQPFLTMLARGVEDIRCRQEEGTACAFELYRRGAEYFAEQQLVSLYKLYKDKWKNLQNKVFLQFSPYPEEEDKERVRVFGYKPEERLGKLRFEVFNHGVRQTIEISVANSSVAVFKRLLEKLGIAKDDFAQSVDFLPQLVDLGPAEDGLAEVIGIVEIYDALLAQEKGEAEFFCGRQVEHPAERDYAQLLSRQRWVQDEGGPFIRRIYALDLELAIALKTATLTPQVEERVHYWLGARNAQGEFLLGKAERKILRQALAAEKLTKPAAAVLKKSELVSTWSIFACMLNGQRAQELFGAEAVETVQDKISSEWGMANEDDGLFAFAAQLAGAGQTQFALCGGVLEFSPTETKVNLYRLPLDTAAGVLFGKELDELFVWVCRKCGYRHKINVPTRQFKAECENCGASGKCEG